MAHSWVQSFESEADAFATYARLFPGATTLLVDTYDVEKGVRKAAQIEPAVQAVRIDSGDLGELARRARSILDAHDRAATKILGSGDLDEHSIGALVAAEVPFDAFGVGTELITSRDAPALSMVYKLVELDGAGRVKLSPGKKTYPLTKQVFRCYDDGNRFAYDRVTGAGESAEGEPLLIPVILEGKLAGPLPRLEIIRSHCRDQLARLPAPARARHEGPAYPIVYSDLLEDEARRLGVR